MRLIGSPARLLPLACVGLLLLTFIPPAETWTYKTHQYIAKIAYDALPSFVRENLEKTSHYTLKYGHDLIYQASTIPDMWRTPYYGEPIRYDNAHTFTYVSEQAIAWLDRAADNYSARAWDNAAYCMGIAAHYLGDAFTMVHNDNVWGAPEEQDGPGFVEERGGWTLHEHFEHQVYYYIPKTPTYDTAAPTDLDAYLNYLSDEMNEFAYETWEGGRWEEWAENRDCDLLKEDVDRATFYLYNAWCRVVGYSP